MQIHFAIAASATLALAAGTSAQTVFSFEDGTTAPFDTNSGNVTLSVGPAGATDGDLALQVNSSDGGFLNNLRLAGLSPAELAEAGTVSFDLTVTNSVNPEFTPQFRVEVQENGSRANTAFQPVATTDPTTLTFDLASVDGTGEFVTLFITSQSNSGGTPRELGPGLRHRQLRRWRDPRAGLGRRPNGRCRPARRPPPPPPVSDFRLRPPARRPVSRGPARFPRRPPRIEPSFRPQ